MKVNDIFEFKKTKNRYRVLGFGSMKDPSDGEWLDSVIYEPYQEYKKGAGYVPYTNKKIYVRETADFLDRFTPSIPPIQIIGPDGGLVYEFGVSEEILSRYFTDGFGMGKEVHGPADMRLLGEFAQSLGADIMLTDMKKADERISQGLLDAIRKDIKAGVFSKNLGGLREVQNLIYFLSIPQYQEEEKEVANDPNIEEVEIYRKPEGVPDSEAMTVDELDKLLGGAGAEVKVEKEDD